MSDTKNLLNESQIRQFMKLASLTPLVPGFVHGLTERTNDDIEESNGRGKWESAAGPRDGAGGQNARNEGFDDAGEELEFAADDLEGGSPEEDEEAVADIEMADDEMGDDVEGPGRMIAVDDFLSALETALEDVMGDEVEIDSDEMSDEDPDAAEVEDEIAMDAVADEEAEVEDEMMQEATDEDVTTEATDEDVTTEATDDLVEQVTKRVAARILKSALAKKK